MTQRERDARWWRELARDYERRSRRVKVSLGDGEYMCKGLTRVSFESDHTLGVTEHRRRWMQMEAFGFTGAMAWWPDAPDAYDLRATACCLIAAMVEAGDA